jgi:hypothetical protein
VENVRLLEMQAADAILQQEAGAFKMKICRGYGIWIHSDLVEIQIKHLYGYNYTLRQFKLATLVQHNMLKVYEALMSDPLGAQDVDYEVFAKCFYSARQDPIREDDTTHNNHGDIRHIWDGTYYIKSAGRTLSQVMISDRQHKLLIKQYQECQWFVSYVTRFESICTVCLKIDIHPSIYSCDLSGKFITPTFQYNMSNTHIYNKMNPYHHHCNPWKHFDTNAHKSNE